MSTTHKEFIRLPLSFLLEVITNSPPSYLPTRPVSRRPNTPDFMPGIVRYELGVLLQSLDPDEEVCKVFLYQSTSHAEVWLKSEWLQSNTYYWSLKESSAEYQAKQDEIAEVRRKEYETFKDYMHYLVHDVGMPDDTPATAAVAKMLIRATGMGHEMIDGFPGLRVYLKKKGYIKE